MALKRHFTDVSKKSRKRGLHSLRPSRRATLRPCPEGFAGKPRKRLPDFRWTKAISEGEWEIYRTAINVLRSTKVPFMLGGGFALATFTGRWRDTKDIDFYIHPRDRNIIVAALTRAGF